MENSEELTDEHVGILAQLCPTRCDHMDCPVRLLCPWDSPGKNTGVGCQCPPPGNLPDPGIEPESLASPALAGKIFYY